MQGVRSMEKLLLLDGNSMLFRAYYATVYGRMMKTSNGIPTNAIFGFVTMFQKALAQIEPDGVMVAWDAGKPTFRHEMYPDYKGTRKELDQELIVQFPIAREFLDACGIRRYECEGIEADDIIGSFAKAHPQVHTTILTSDRDLLQLIDDTTVTDTTAFSFNSEYWQIITGTEPVADMFADMKERAMASGFTDAEEVVAEYAEEYGW